MASGHDNKGFESGYINTKAVEDAQIHLSFRKDGRWKRRTGLEKGLIVLVSVFVLVIVVLVIVLGRNNADDVPTVQGTPSPVSTQTQQEICNRSDCVLAAARLFENMDTSVDPCEDFYMYACGSFKRKNVIPEDSMWYGMWSVLRHNVDVTNKYLLEDTERYTEDAGIRKAKDMYTSCIDLDTIEDKNSSVAMPLFDELGGWPVLGLNPGGNWSESNFNLPQLLIMLRQYNDRPLINLYVYSDVKASENNVINIDQPFIGLPGRNYYFDEDLAYMREAYVKLASSVAMLFGADETTAYADMRKVLELETDLANISMRSEDRRDDEVLYNKMTISELKQNFTEPEDNVPIQFDWLEYVSGVFDLERVKVQINTSEPVVVWSVPYFEQMFNVLQKHGKRTVTNYLVWYTMRNRCSNLDSRFRDLLSKYYKAVYGTTSAKARWKSCVGYTVTTFSKAVGHMFVKEAFDKSSKTAALEMIGNIRTAFSELVDELDWMDEPTKGLAREKASVIKEWIGFPDDILDLDKINKLYENVTIYRTEYFQNVLNNLKMFASNGLRTLRQKFDKNVWNTPPSTVNAFYSGIRNTIMFPAGILQPPFYSKNQPKSMNYGAIGAVIGHEITHGFDDQGRQYDKDGNLRQWWDDTIINNFKEKAQCFIDQYSSFKVEEVDLYLNGINTQGENIADNGGLKQSFRAYRQWVDKQGKEEPLLPGLNFTHNQLFFINYAQIWCESSRKEDLIYYINNGVHSPAQFRVLGTMQNSPDFADAFRCRINSFMNPERKCYVW